MTRICPKCRANLASVPVRNGKLRCPKCETLLSVARDDERRQTTATESHRAQKPQKTKSLSIALLALEWGVGLFILLMLGGGVVALLYLRPTTSATMVASAPPQEPEKTVAVAPLSPESAEQPIHAAMSAPADPEPTKQPAQPTPPAQTNPEPAKETPQSEHQTQAVASGSGKLPLKELKAASVYVKGRTATRSWSGSGFVVLAQGSTVYVATNHHVVSPPEPKVEAPPQPPPSQPSPGLPGIPRIPIGPRRPVIPRMPRRPFALETPPGSPGEGLTVVFHSGTAKEQSLPATVVGDDAASDLAILRTVGVVEVPRPINYQRNPELMETMPVVMFGFPLGRLLDRKRANPAITVTKGNISALRGTGDEIEDVQLDIDMNPGNSGGPVVNERGELIGVAYSGWNNTNISYAVPVPKLIHLLQGRIDPPAALELVTEQGRQQVRVRATASDPLGKLRSPTLLYGLATEVRMPGKLRTAWGPLSGAKSSALTLQGTEATATLALTPPASGQLQIIAQVSYQTATGQTVYGEPRTLNLGAAKPPPAVAGTAQPAKPAPPSGSAPRPSHPLKGDELTKLLADLKSADEATRQRAAALAKSSGLLAYWSFEEGEGERATDASGNGLHAKLINAGWTDGIRGKALRLSGKESYLDYGDSPRLSFAARAPFTIAFWTRTTRAKGTLLSQRNSRDGGAVIDILISDGKAKVQVRQDGNDIFGPTEVVSGTINDGAWHHLALTRDGDSIELFLDGVSQGRKSGNLSGGAITTDLRALGAERYWLKQRTFAFGDPHFEGDLDEFCIFERELKTDEIAALALR